MKFEEVVETLGGGACLKKVVLWGKMQSLKDTSGPGPFSNPCLMAVRQRAVLHKTNPKTMVKWPCSGTAEAVSIFL